MSGIALPANAERLALVDWLRALRTDGHYIPYSRDIVRPELQVETSSPIRQILVSSWKWNLKT